jgi:uncharacterized protein (DUF2252 family)
VTDTIDQEAAMTEMTVAERAELGRALRSTVPRTAHAEWVPPSDRADPVELLAAQNTARLEQLVPIRHARMSVSPFTFYRGAARIMAADLARTPTTGLTVQLGGDAHLSNFGAYASPERQLVFDQNDFDETLPGPWEWDVKRLATSFVVAGRFHGFDTSACRSLAAEVVRAYRLAMKRFAGEGYLELWYDYVGVEDVTATAGMTQEEFHRRLDRFAKRATNRTSQHALGKLAEQVDGGWRIRSEPPVLFPVGHSDIADSFGGEETFEAARTALEDYKDTLDDARHDLLDRYRMVDVGIKVVGVGSVGTRCLILLMLGRDDQDPLFLQAKEATASVLEDHLPASRYDNHGRRVVEGQRLVQAQSDIFLGWTTGSLEGRDYYVRQLRDWKGSVDVEAKGTTVEQLMFYADLCGLTLARGHARSGDAEAIRAYAGKGDRLDDAIATFSLAYAKQNLKDYESFRQAVSEGRIPCSEAG